MKDLGHKEGCLYNPDPPGTAHRVPIDCTTLEDFEKSVERLKQKIGILEAENQKLKANLYDLEHEERY